MTVWREERITQEDENKGIYDFWCYQNSDDRLLFVEMKIAINFILFFHAIDVRRILTINLDTAVVPSSP